MPIKKQDVLDWLARENHSREWLAEKCGVGPTAVGNWLGKNSPRPIPAKAVLIIENLMAVDRAREAQRAAVPQNLVLEFSQAEFDTICEASMASRKKPREWAEDTLLEIAGEDVEALARKLRPRIGSGEGGRYPSVGGKDQDEAMVEEVVEEVLAEEAAEKDSGDKDPAETGGGRARGRRPAP